ncbi:hypothetical protein F2Q69_00040074 [Brassica cretica]|uniref:Uncharacterized protein n=1 Tax=Brassica cretica TaxID=69181 RepID=A0A8S9NNB0_BRACR|nr:hypothetical protein F2Q69_00040074 [Brassica cretica]
MGWAQRDGKRGRWREVGMRLDQEHVEEERMVGVVVAGDKSLQPWSQQGS